MQVKAFKIDFLCGVAGLLEQRKETVRMLLDAWQGAVEVWASELVSADVNR